MAPDLSGEKNAVYAPLTANAWRRSSRPVPRPDLVAVSPRQPQPPSQDLRGETIAGGLGSNQGTDLLLGLNGALQKYRHLHENAKRHSCLQVRTGSLGADI